MMPLFQALYQLIIGPLEILFEFIYGISYQIVRNPGAAIIPLSLALNFMLLPFYNRAYEIQEDERRKEDEMRKWVTHIKKTFKGDERYMMLQAYYKEHQYKPIYTIRSSFSLVLQVPFFIAAYTFMSNLSLLDGTSYGCLADLGKPDALISTPYFSVNVLPILMTVINIISSSVYTQDYAIKEKLKLYGVALVFLFFLYDSPSGLVFYWTLNNIFGLLKNLVKASPKAVKFVNVLMSLMGLYIIWYMITIYMIFDGSTLLMTLLGLCFQIPLFNTLTLKGKIRLNLSADKIPEEDKKCIRPFFLSGTIVLAILTGVVIPASVIKSSPAEFITEKIFISPLYYVLSAALLSFGMFVLWCNLFYYMLSVKSQKILNIIICVVGIISVIDYIFFGTKLGNLSSEMKYDIGLSFTHSEIFINTMVVLLLLIILVLLYRFRKKMVKNLLWGLAFVLAVMSVYNIYGIAVRIPELKSKYEERSENEKAVIHLSKTGKNVIIFMLDRAICSYVPYLMKERPDLLDQFDGFIYYPQTLSYGTRTNTGSPALFGGYEYIPERMNKRTNEPLESKQNEALKVLPVLFYDAGYDVTVCDPPYAGYELISDLSIYDDYKDIHTYHTKDGQYAVWLDIDDIKFKLWKRNLFCFSLMKITPLCIQRLIYQDGKYFNLNADRDMLWQSQITDGVSKGKGTKESFYNNLSVLQSLGSMTKITKEDKGCFLMIANNTTHDVVLLKEPEYKPDIEIDNTEYDIANSDRFTVNGRTIKVDTAYQMSHYQCNMAAFIQLGKWFDMLRREGVYDNTRIILVADHGWPLEQFENLIFGNTYKNKTIYNPEDIMAYNPLLMVKDFDAKGFVTDDSFMTNADVPLIAIKDIIDEAVNPFTGNVLSDDIKYEKEQHVFYTDIWGVEENNGNTFLPGIWYSVSGEDMLNADNWRKIGEY